MRVRKRKEYWWNIIYGGLLTFIILNVIGFIILSKLQLDVFYSYYFTLCLFVVMYYQWSDDNYTAVESSFSKAENYELIKIVLDRLDWKYKVYTTGIQIIHDQELLKFLNVCIVAEDDIIYYNFQYRSFMLVGRLPFMLGILTVVRRRFFRNLSDEIAKESQLMRSVEFDRSGN